MAIFAISETDLVDGDEDLVALLKQASAAQLAPLVEALTGHASTRFKMRPAIRRQLLGAHERQHYTHDDVVVMVHELEHFGGNTLANAYRRKGVAYRDIVLAVLKRLDLKDVDSQADIATLELRVLENMVEDGFQSMDDPARKALLRRLGVKDENGQAGLKSLKSYLKSGKLNPRHLPDIVSSQIIPQFRKHVLPMAKSTAPRLWHAGRYLRSPYVAVPAAVAGAGALAYRLTLENYRVMIPCVVQIARIRQAAADKSAVPVPE